jgi:predicted transcriptional regulator
MPLTRNAVSHYERGIRPVPLWVARRVHDLAEAARVYDADLMARRTT